MQEQLPRLDTLMEKRADDDAMYKARCRAMNDLVYQLEDENNLIGIKIAQTKRRIAEKQARIREAEERIAAAERGDISDEDDDAGDLEGDWLGGTVQAKKSSASSRKGVAVSGKDKAGPGQSASQAQVAVPDGAEADVKRADTAAPATPTAQSESDRPVPPAGIDVAKLEDQADEGVKAGEAAADPTSGTTVDLITSSPRARQSRGMDGEEVDGQADAAEGAVLREGLQVHAGAGGEGPWDGD